MNTISVQTKACGSLKGPPQIYIIVNVLEAAGDALLVWELGFAGMLTPKILSQLRLPTRVYGIGTMQLPVFIPSKVQPPEWATQRDYQLLKPLNPVGLGEYYTTKYNK